MPNNLSTDPLQILVVLLGDAIEPVFLLDINNLMTGWSLNEAENRMLHLHTSIENISKTIQQTKVLFAGAVQPYQSTHSHHSVSLRQHQHQELIVNISMSVASPEGYQLTEDPEIKFVNINGHKYISQKQFGKIKHQKVNHLGLGSQEAFMKYSFGVSEQVAQESRVRVVDDNQPVLSIPNMQHGGVFDTPSAKKPVREVEDTTVNIHKRMSEQRRSPRKPIFPKKVHISYFAEAEQPVDKFQGIRNRLKMTQSLIQQLANRRAQEYTEAARQSDDNPKGRSRKCLSNHSKKEWPSKDNRLRGKRPSSVRANLFSYLSTKTVKADNRSIICDKFRKEIQRDIRQRYIRNAMRIPGVQKSFTHTDLYQMYIEFRKTGYPEYKWIQVITEKVRPQHSFPITSSRYTTI